MNRSRAVFEYLAQFVSDQSSIVLDPSREEIVQSRLRPLLVEQLMNNLEELALALRRDRFSPLHRRVLDAITNNETSFFRDGYQFDALKKLCCLLCSLEDSRIVCESGALDHRAARKYTA